MITQKDIERRRAELQAEREKEERKWREEAEKQKQEKQRKARIAVIDALAGEAKDECERMHNQCRALGVAYLGEILSELPQEIIFETIKFILEKARRDEPIWSGALYGAAKVFGDMRREEESEFLRYRAGLAGIAERPDDDDYYG